MGNDSRPFTLRLANETGILAQKISGRWLTGIAETNPAILDMFRDRDVKPYRDLLPWSGEFAGKYLASAYYIYRITRDEALYAYAAGFIAELLALQGEDGYLGCYQRDCRLTGAFSQDPGDTGKTWDAWSHYHVMHGLFLWYKQTGNRDWLGAVEKAAALFLRMFYNGEKRLVDIGSTEMNLAPLHIFALLCRETGERKYLDFAMEIVRDLSGETAGNYIDHSLNGLEFYECPKPRWESLHVILGVAELYRCTGERKYLDAARQIFYSILKTDVHNTGAFSTDEQAVGHPFKNAAIETCCVVAYNMLASELLMLTGDCAIADFLELSHFNAVMGAFSPSGAWSTYSTPMEGVKCANYHSINFQCRPGSPQLNCCSVNAPVAVGMLADWAAFEREGAVYLNHFENATLRSEPGLEIRISGDYPASDAVRVEIAAGSARALALRIPGWSVRTAVRVNGRAMEAAAGEYLRLTDVGAGDVVTLQFDFTARFTDGDLDYKGMKSIYKGPILYGLDASENPGLDIDRLPAIPLADLRGAAPERLPGGMIALRLKNGMVLNDFYRLGCGGSRYRTWFAVGE